MLLNFDQVPRERFYNFVFRQFSTVKILAIATVISDQFFVLESDFWF